MRPELNVERAMEVQMIDQQEIGRRLRLARESAGLTQEEVARRIGVSRLVYGHMELGKRVVSSMELERLAFTFGRNMADFVTGDFDVAQDPLAAIFRAQPEVADRPEVVETLRECLQLGRELASLEDLLDFQRNLHGVPVYDFGRPRSRWEAVEQGARVADDERRRLGLGRAPLGDMADFLEQRGVRVAVEDLPADVSGVTLNAKDIGVFVVVNRTHGRERRRFSHAHEYAHVLFDREQGGMVSRTEDNAEFLEVRANSFAARFLVPDDGLRQALLRFGKGRGGRSATDVPTGDGVAVRAEAREEAGSQEVQFFDVVQIATYFGVSRVTLLYRLKNIGAITQAQLEHLKEQDRVIGRQATDLLGLAESPEQQEESRDAFRRTFLMRAFEAYHREKISRKKLIKLATTIGAADREAIEDLIDAIDEGEAEVAVDGTHGTVSDERARQEQKAEAEAMSLVDY